MMTQLGAYYHQRHMWESPQLAKKIYVLNLQLIFLIAAYSKEY
jgi:hypothetical protein